MCIELIYELGLDTDGPFGVGAPKVAEALSRLFRLDPRRGHLLADAIRDLQQAYREAPEDLRALAASFPFAIEEN